MAPRKSATPPETEIRLIELRVDNFKKLRAVSIKPDGGVFNVAGKNEAGKSSVLDAFMAAIDGPKYFPPEPVRRGETESLIQVNLGKLIVVRRIFAKEGGGFGHEVVVQFSDGKRPSKPQTVLDELRGSPIADDPLAFTRLKPKERLDLLKKLVPGVDFVALAKERQDKFDERTQVGRDFDRAKAAVESIVLEPGHRTKFIDVNELAAQLREVGQFNADIDTRAANRQSARDQIETLLDAADQLRALATAKEAEAKALQAKLDAAPELPEHKNAAVIQGQIAAADAINAEVRRYNDRVAKIEERDDLSRDYDALSKEIEDIDATKAKAIAGAKLPVEGLGFGEEDIELDGLPFEQASSARKIRVATALLMAMKPDIKVLLVREGSLLDDDMRAALDEEAKKNGFVVLMETVGGGDGTGVVIQDGAVL